MRVLLEGKEGMETLHQLMESMVSEMKCSGVECCAVQYTRRHEPANLAPS